jgi:hypothetical protein
MKLSLREKQSIFVRGVAELIQHATGLGYELTFGECFRSKEEAERLANADKGIKNSLHTVRLAIDLNLFKGGKYLSKSEDYRALGEWWEAKSVPDLTYSWGGRFQDGNHFSIAHEGKK